jgi:hypothetical protein
MLLSNLYKERHEPEFSSPGHELRPLRARRHPGRQGHRPTAQVKVDLAGGKVEVETTQPREAVAKAIADEGYAVAA